MTTNTIFSVPEVHCEHCKSALEGALAPPGASRRLRSTSRARP
jgi:hypothetical protein